MRFHRMALFGLAVCLLAVASRISAMDYAAYPYDRGGTVLDFGVQPVSLPDVMVTEVMRRDRILQQALAAGGNTMKQHAYFKGNDMLPYLRDRQLEAAVFGDMPALRAAAGGEVLLVALLKQSFSSVVAGRFMQLKELMGKRIAYGQGSTAHYTLLEALAAAGLSEKDVTLVPMEVNDMPAALEKGLVDAFSAWEPAPTIALAKHPEYSVVYRGLNMSFLVMSRQYVENHPDATLYFVAAYVRAINWMRARRHNLESAAHWALQAGATFSGKPAALTAEQAARITQREILDVPSAPLIPDVETTERGTLYREFLFLNSQARLPGNPGWNVIRGSFARTLLEEVFTHPGKYRIGEFDYSN
jgi:NitT/TauT family transport system substrate-binding protein